MVCAVEKASRTWISARSRSAEGLSALDVMPAMDAITPRMTTTISSSSSVCPDSLRIPVLQDGGQRVHRGGGRHHGQEHRLAGLAEVEGGRPLGRLAVVAAAVEQLGVGERDVDAGHVAFQRAFG